MDIQEYIRKTRPTHTFFDLSGVDYLNEHYQKINNNIQSVLGSYLATDFEYPELIITISSKFETQLKKFKHKSYLVFDYEQAHIMFKLYGLFSGGQWGETSEYLLKTIAHTLNQKGLHDTALLTLLSHTVYIHSKPYFIDIRNTVVENINSGKYYWKSDVELLVLRPGASNVVYQEVFMLYHEVFHSLFYSNSINKDLIIKFVKAELSHFGIKGARPIDVDDDILEEVLCDYMAANLTMYHFQGQADPRDLLTIIKVGLNGVNALQLISSYVEFIANPKKNINPFEKNAKASKEVEVRKYAIDTFIRKYAMTNDVDLTFNYFNVIVDAVDFNFDTGMLLIKNLLEVVGKVNNLEIPFSLYMLSAKQKYKLVDHYDAFDFLELSTKEKEDLDSAIGVMMFKGLAECNHNLIPYLHLVPSKLVEKIENKLKTEYPELHSFHEHYSILKQMAENDDNTTAWLCGLTTGL